VKKFKQFTKAKSALQEHKDQISSLNSRLKLATELSESQQTKLRAVELELEISKSKFSTSAGQILALEMELNELRSKSKLTQSKNGSDQDDRVKQYELKLKQALQTNSSQEAQLIEAEEKLKTLHNNFNATVSVLSSEVLLLKQRNEALETQLSIFSPIAAAEQQKEKEILARIEAELVARTSELEIKIQEIEKYKALVHTAEKKLADKEAMCKKAMEASTTFENILKSKEIELKKFEKAEQKVKVLEESCRDRDLILQELIETKMSLALAMADRDRDKKDLTELRRHAKK